MKAFGEGVRLHVREWDPYYFNVVIRHVVLQEMTANVNVLLLLGKCLIFCDHHS